MNPLLPSAASSAAHNVGRVRAGQSSACGAHRHNRIDLPATNRVPISFHRYHQYHIWIAHTNQIKDNK